MTVSCILSSGWPSSAFFLSPHLPTEIVILGKKILVWHIKVPKSEKKNKKKIAGSNL